MPTHMRRPDRAAQIARIRRARAVAIATGGTPAGPAQRAAYDRAVEDLLTALESETAS